MRNRYSPLTAWTDDCEFAATLNYHPQCIHTYFWNDYKLLFSVQSQLFQERAWTIVSRSTTCESATTSNYRSTCERAPVSRMILNYTSDKTSLFSLTTMAGTALTTPIPWDTLRHLCAQVRCTATHDDNYTVEVIIISSWIRRGLYFVAGTVWTHELDVPNRLDHGALATHILASPPSASKVGSST